MKKKINLPTLVGSGDKKMKMMKMDMKMKKTGGGYGGSSVKIPQKGASPSSGKVKMPRQKAPKVLKG